MSPSDRGLTVTIALMRFIAHRGLAGPSGIPTADTLTEAIRQGSDHIEVDVRAAGGQLVVCHDARLDDGRAVAMLGADHVRTAGILTLDEVSEIVGDRVPLLLDARAGTLLMLVRWLGQRSDVGHIAVTTDDHAALLAIREAVPGVQLWPTLPVIGEAPLEPARRIASGLLRHRLPSLIPELVARLAPQAFSVDHWAVTPALAAGLRDRDIGLVAWAVNRPGRAVRLAQMGVTGITTEHIVHLRSALHVQADKSTGRF